MSSGWRWVHPPRFQAGCALGSRHPGLVLDIAVPPLSAAERTAVAGMLHGVFGAGVPGGPDAADAAGLLTWGLQELIRVAAMPIAEPPRVVARGPVRLTLRVPVVPRMAAPLARACEALLQALAAPAEGGDPASPPWLEAFAALQRGQPGSSNTFRFMRAAEGIGMPVQELGARLVQYGQGRRSRWIDSTFTQSTSAVGANIARDKRMGATLLQRAGLPVPAQRAVGSAEAAVEAAMQLGFPVVVKPADRDGGVGVSVGLADEQSVSRAFERARAHSRRVLVERFVAGRDYRLLVHNGELIWAVERLAAGITGDGRATVAECVDALNADPRRQGPQPVLRPVPLDEEALELLRDAGFTPDSVPARGQFLRLRRAANVATGGMPVPALDQVHPDNALLAVRAAAALRLDLAGIDLLIPDIGISWRESGAGICEVNAQPNLGALTSAHVYAQLLHRMVPGNGRIPVVAVLGAPREGTLLPAIERAVAAHGLRVGAADAAGLRLGGVTLRADPAPAAAMLTVLLQDPTTDAAIVAFNEPDCLETGLPCAAVDLLVVAGDDVRASDGMKPGDARARLERMLRQHCDGDIVTLDSTAGADAPDRLAGMILDIDARHAALHPAPPPPPPPLRTVPSWTRTA